MTMCMDNIAGDVPDAADDEDRCLKAEVEILRGHARRSTASCSQHLPSPEDALTPEVPAARSINGMPGCRLATAPLLDSLEAQQTGANACSIAATQHSPRQQPGFTKQHHQQQQQSHQSSGEASEVELAAVEQGLSALDQQITAAALRYALWLGYALIKLCV